MQKILSAQFNFYLVLATCLMHVLCCGIPLVLSIGTLAAMAGLSGGEWLHPEWLHAYESSLIWISGGVLAFTGLVQLISSRINCRTDGDCHHKPCEPKKTLAQHLYAIAVALFVVNLLFTLLTH